MQSDSNSDTKLGNVVHYPWFVCICLQKALCAVTSADLLCWAQQGGCWVQLVGEDYPICTACENMLYFLCFDLYSLALYVVSNP